jgi:GMP reductase
MCAQDVLIRPKRSTLKSRSEVTLERTFAFRNSKREWTGVPIFAANMVSAPSPRPQPQRPVATPTLCVCVQDTTGTFAVARALASHKMCTAAHKFYGVEDWVAFAGEHADALPYLSVSTGISDADLRQTAAICDAVPDLHFITVDVANGYSEAFISKVRTLREAHPRHTIIAGNVGELRGIGAPHQHGPSHPLPALCRRVSDG